MIGHLTLKHETAASVLAEVSLTANTGAMARLRWTVGSPWRCGSPGQWGRVLVLVQRGSAAGRAAGRLQAAAGCADRTNRGSPGGATTRSTRLLQPWRTSSQ